MAIQTTKVDPTPLGDDLEYDGHHIVFNTTLAADNTASGDIKTVTFGEDVVFGQLCYADSDDNEWKLALGTNVAVKHPAMGVALESKGNGETGKLLLRGLIRDATYFSGFAEGDSLYLSDGTAGSWVNAKPSDSGDIVQYVGWCPAANYAFFDPSPVYVELGVDIISISGWIQFDGTGTISISDSFNVSSIDDNGVGDYTVNWDTDFANDDYAVSALCNNRHAHQVGIATSSFEVWTSDNNHDAIDSAYIHVIAIGDQV